MSVETVRGLRVALAAEQIDGDGKQWIQVMPTADKARNGQWYFTVTRDDLEAYAEFVRQNPDKIVVDYDHEGDTGGSTVAAGWFTGQAEVRDDENGPTLWAEVEWTPQGLDDVKSKRFRFISPVFSFSRKDAKTGLMTKAKELIAATVTNRPFFRQLAPVARELLDDDDLEALSADFGQDIVALAFAGLAGTDEQREAAERILAAVWTTAYINDLPDSSFLHIENGGSKDSAGKTAPRSLRHFPVKDDSGKVDLPHLRNALSRIPQSSLPSSLKERLTTKAQSMLKSAGGTSASTEGDHEMDTAVLAKSLGLSEDATEEQITEALKARDAELEELKAKVAASESNDDEDERIKKLEDELAAERTKRIEAERDQILTDAVRDRRIDPAQKDELIKEFGDDVDKLRTVVGMFQPKPVSVRGSAGSSGEGGEEDAAVRAVEEQFTTSEELPVDGADVHVRAISILTDKGKADTYTNDEYISACEQASKELVAA